MKSEWVVLADYASQMEADLDIALLEEHEIPCMVRGPEVGIFGPGFSGATSRGIQLLVPAEALEEARDLTQDDE